MRTQVITALVAALLLGGTAQAAAGPGPLTTLVVQRLLLADKVAAAKFGTGQPIADPVREQQVLDTVARLSTEMGIDPAVSVPFFRDQIEAGKIVQRGLFRRWRARPDRVPAHRPDLITEVRPQLDRLTKQLLANLRRPECPARIRLDPLHRRALVVAMRSLAHC